MRAQRATTLHTRADQLRRAAVGDGPDRARRFDECGYFTGQGFTPQIS
jgi:hypothetical protein